MIYYLSYSLLYLFSLLPLRVLHFVGDIFYLFIYYIMGYRVEVVMNNLSIAFPGKTQQERTRIAKKFYRNLTDTFAETIKLMSASNKFLKNHFTGNMEVLNDLYKEGRKCQVHLGHNFNWELASMATPLYVSYQMLIVYMPIKNKTMDRIFRKIRARTGAVLISAREMRTSIKPYLDQQYLLALVADQNPGDTRNHYWGNFFGRPTPFVKGPESGARANQAAVVFCNITKKKRGYYQVHFELASADPNELPEQELTRRYIRYLEKVITADPEMWLWSHRRWKHQWKPEYQAQWVDDIPAPQNV